MALVHRERPSKRCLSRQSGNTGVFYLFIYFFPTDNLQKWKINKAYSAKNLIVSYLIEIASISKQTTKENFLGKMISR